MAKLSAEQVAEHYQAELIGADDIGDLAELIAEQAAEIEEWRAQWRSLNTHWLGISEEYSTEQAIEELQHKLREQGARIKELESDAAVGRSVRAKLASGNSVPIERCVIRADEVAAIDAAWHQQQAAECFRQIGEAP